MASKLLEELNTLRRNLEKNTKQTPDYHITKKISGKPSDKPKPTPTPKKTFAPENIKEEIYLLMDNGFNNKNTSIAVTDKLNQKYQTYRFKSIQVIVDILNELSKKANKIIFVVDKEHNTIYWENKGVQELRIIIQ